MCCQPSLLSFSSFCLKEIIVLEEGDLIAKRTRSQLPLEDIPLEKIEGNALGLNLLIWMSCSVKRDWLTDGLLLSLTATFQPPDFTADMYDTIKEDDLDFEDIEWQKWLQGLINSGAVPIHASCVSQNTNLHVCLCGVLLLVSFNRRLVLWRSLELACKINT